MKWNERKNAVLWGSGCNNNIDNNKKDEHEVNRRIENSRMLLHSEPGYIYRYMRILQCLRRSYFYKYIRCVCVRVWLYDVHCLWMVYLMLDLLVFKSVIVQLLLLLLLLKCSCIFSSMRQVPISNSQSLILVMIMFISLWLVSIIIIIIFWIFSVII